jgi:hypothetical protein
MFGGSFAGIQRIGKDFGSKCPAMITIRQIQVNLLSSKEIGRIRPLICKIS